MTFNKQRHFIHTAIYEYDYGIELICLADSIYADKHEITVTSKVVFLLPLKLPSQLI